MDAIGEIRKFNRFYTRQIGLLNESLSGSGFSLAEARVLYELATTDAPAAADLVRKLAMDKAHLSRLLGRFKSRGLVRRSSGATRGKRAPLSLTDRGTRAFARLDRGTREQMEALIAPLGGHARTRLVSDMRAIQASLGHADNRTGSIVLRAPRPGDLAWIAHRQALLYASEYDFDWTFEGLVCEILAQFIAQFDPARDAAWIAEHDGLCVGTVFLVKSAEPDVAKLRLLYVEPASRGMGVGRLLVETCIARAREVGYKELTLWTNDILVAARRIYETAGFRLVSQSPHHSFGRDLVGQTWSLDL
jgi:DNA-binding MarR family transcriptional regulator/N-acetylglutamate synthase-like GNAT family acetyltransferase